MAQESPQEQFDVEFLHDLICTVPLLRAPVSVRAPATAGGAAAISLVTETAGNDMVRPDYDIKTKQEKGFGAQQTEPKGSMKPFLALPAPMSNGRTTIPEFCFGLVAATLHVLDELGQVVKEHPRFLRNLTETLEAVRIPGVPTTSSYAI